MLVSNSWISSWITVNPGFRAQVEPVLRFTPKQGMECDEVWELGEFPYPTD